MAKKKSAPKMPASVNVQYGFSPESLLKASQAYGQDYEGLQPVEQGYYIPFVGGMDTNRQPCMLPMGAFSSVQNMRPVRPGMRKRKGQRVLHSTADGTNQAQSIFQFSKGRKTEAHLFCQWSDGDIHDATTAPPGVTTGAFGTALFACGTTGLVPASSCVMDDICYVANGTGSALYYSGTASPVVKFVVVIDTAAHTMQPQKGNDYSMEVTDGLTTTFAVLSSLSVLTDHDAIYICTDTPAKAFNFTIASANASAAALQGHYCKGDGVWSAVSSISDGTDTGGASMAKDGTVSYTMPTDIVPTYMFGVCGYWIRLSLASGAFDASTTVSAVTYESDMLRMQNAFCGIPPSSIEAYFWDNSASVYLHYSPQGMSLGSMTDADKVYFSSSFPIEAFYIDPGATPNTTATTAIDAVYGWTGSAFSAVSNLVDGTAGISKPGWVTFGRLAGIQPTLFQEAAVPMYWYYFEVDKTLSTPITVLDIELVPYYDITDLGNCVALESWKGRMVYAFDRDCNYILLSGSNAPTCINGPDMGIQDVGDGRTNKVTAIKKFYNEILVWQEEKGKDGGCLTLVEGYTPQTLGILVISSVYGTFSSKSAIVIENFPYTEPVAKSEKGESVSVQAMRPMAAFISREGIMMSDGKSVWNITSDKLQRYFDPNQTAYCLRRGYEKQHWIGYETTTQVLRVGIVTGTTATAPNVFLAYDVARKEWSVDVLGQALSCHAEVEAGSGDAPVVHVGGGTADGFVYQLNYGQNDVAAAVDSFALVELNSAHLPLRLDELILRLKVQSAGNVTVTPYVNAIAGTARTLSMTAEATSEIMRRHRVGFDGLRGNSLSLKFQNATAAEDMELLDMGLAIFREVGR